MVPGRCGADRPGDLVYPRMLKGGKKDEDRCFEAAALLVADPGADEEKGIKLYSPSPLVTSGNIAWSLGEFVHFSCLVAREVNRRERRPGKSPRDPSREEDTTNPFYSRPASDEGCEATWRCKHHQVDGQPPSDFSPQSGRFEVKRTSSGMSELCRSRQSETIWSLRGRRTHKTDKARRVVIYLCKNCHQNLVKFYITSKKGQKALFC